MAGRGIGLAVDRDLLGLELVEGYAGVLREQSRAHQVHTLLARPLGGRAGARTPPDALGETGRLRFDGEDARAARRARDTGSGDRRPEHLSLGTGVIGVGAALGRHVAETAPDGQGHLELAALGQRRDLMVRVEDLQLGGDVDVRSHHLARLVLDQPDHDLVQLAVQTTDQPLEVKDDIGYVFLDAGDGGELVGDSLDLDGADRCSLERAEQHLSLIHISDLTRP